MAKKSNNGKKTKNEKLSELLNETRPTVHLNIESEQDEFVEPVIKHPVSGSFRGTYSNPKWETKGKNGTASIESLGTRLSGLTAYKTVVNGVERVVDLKNMDEAIEFVNLLINIGDGK